MKVRKIKFFIPIFFILIFCSTLQSQTKSNLDIFYSLADSSVNKITDELPLTKDSINLNLTLGNAYSIFGNRIISSLTKKNKIIVGAETENTLTINLVIDKAKVEYGEMFRDGFLGSQKVPRNLFLTGNYLIKDKNEKVNYFNYAYADTIDVAEIKQLENISYPFTQNEMPAEPFFSSLWEPVIAIGAAAAAVYLFFSVRSK